MKPMHRRTVLRGLLGGGLVTIGLPFLEVFSRRASAAPDGFPKRFGIFFWGNGMREQWAPTGTGTSYELSPTLAPLAEHQAKISVVSGMKVPIQNLVPHGSGPIGFLSGSPPLAGNNEEYAAPTIDQVIANVIGADSRFRSLEIGVAPGVSGLSHNGPHSLNPAETSPAAFFQRVFGPEFVMPGGDAKPNPTLALRKSVLDAVTDDAKSLQGILGATDKSRLEQHLDGVRALEKRIQKLQESPPKLDACKVPMEPKPDYPDVDGRPPLSEISRVMSDLVAMTLACDQTRVFSLWFTQPVTNVLFNGAPSGHHQLTHDEASPQPEVAKILTQIMTELAYFIKALDSVPEGEGTLLDHCGILATSDVSYARQHLITDYPIIIAGSANGALKTGLHYRSPSSENTSKVTLTLARAMGLTLDSFGTAEAKATDGLSAIEV
ncbi:MAG: DUF1552 domain-containing protein [Polyangiales bacterium]